MIYLSNRFNERDIAVIKWQLNTTKLSMGNIVEKCTHGFPAIILFHPIKDCNISYNILSNFLWLSCPYLNKKIHKLESDGYLKKISNFIKKNTICCMNMKNAHVNYYYLRKNIYKYFIGDINLYSNYSKVMNNGIGGIKDTDNVKCLHLHYAHYKVCNDNIAGKITYYLLNKKITCKGVYCNNASYKE